MTLLELHHVHSETPEEPRTFLAIMPHGDQDFIVLWDEHTLQCLDVAEWHPRLVFTED